MFIVNVSREKKVVQEIEFLFIIQKKKKLSQGTILILFETGIQNKNQCLI